MSPRTTSPSSRSPTSSMVWPATSGSTQRLPLTTWLSSVARHPSRHTAWGRRAGPWPDARARSPPVASERPGVHVGQLGVGQFARSCRHGRLLLVHAPRSTPFRAGRGPIAQVWSISRRCAGNACISSAAAPVRRFRRLVRRTFTRPPCLPTGRSGRVGLPTRKAGMTAPASDSAVHPSDSSPTQLDHDRRHPRSTSPSDTIATGMRRAADDRVNWVTSIPFLLVNLSPLLVVFTGIGWKSVGLLLVTFWARMFFITAGYHRYFSHRTYQLARVPAVHHGLRRHDRGPEGPAVVGRPPPRPPPVLRHRGRRPLARRRGSGGATSAGSCATSTPTPRSIASRTSPSTPSCGS